MKLSATQRLLLSRLTNEGATITAMRSPPYRVRENQPGDPTLGRVIRQDTFSALREHGLVEKFDDRRFINLYRITDKGREALKQ